MKLNILLIGIVITTVILVGCNTNTKNGSIDKNTYTPEAEAKNEKLKFYEVTDEETLEKGLKDHYAVILNNDISLQKDLVLQGEFSKTDNTITDKVLGAGRILQLCKLDDNLNVVELYKLTAPRITIKTEDATIKGGTFIGDIYVNADSFTIDESKIEGDVYFTEEKYKDSFIMKNNAVVTGNIEVK